MPFKAVETVRLYQRVAEQIVGLVNAGEFLPGERLPAERELSIKLGVSRPVLREAMVALELAGVVDVRTGSGIYVRAGSGEVHLNDAGPGSVEVLGARKLIEGEVAMLAAAHIRPVDIDRLTDLLENQRRDIAAGLQGHEHDRLFHLTIVEATGNTILVDTVQRLWNSMHGPILQRLHNLTHMPIKHRTVLADHEAIRDALARHDGEAARRAMIDHISHVEAFFIGEPADGAPRSTETTS